MTQNNARIADACGAAGHHRVIVRRFIELPPLHRIRAMPRLTQHFPSLRPGAFVLSARATQRLSHALIRTTRPARLGCVLGGILVNALAGCASNPSAVPSSGSSAHSNHPQIDVAGWLHDRDPIVAIEEGVVQGDMKRIAVDLVGDPKRSRTFGYRFEWFDAAGMPTGPAKTALTVVRIRSNERMTLTSIAPTPAAVRWKLTFENAPE